MIYNFYSNSNDMFDSFNRENSSITYDYGPLDTPEELNQQETPFESDKSMNLPEQDDDDFGETPYTELKNDFEQSNQEKKETNFNTEKINKPKIFYVEKMKKNKNKKKANNNLGRKRFDDENKEKGLHTKFAFDNMAKKIKARTLEAIRIFLNNTISEEKKLEETEETFIQKEKKRKRKIKYEDEFILKIDQEITTTTDVTQNLELLQKTLREIFSNNLCKKNQSYGLEYNKVLLNKIRENSKRVKTNEILDMTFLQSLEHFRKSKYYKELGGLEKEYDKMIDDMTLNEKEEDYIPCFIESLNKYEQLFKQKRPKIKKKKKDLNLCSEFNQLLEHSFEQSSNY